MKTYPWVICFLCTFLAAGCVVAPTRVEAQTQPPAVASPPDALEQLVAPIVLYPDALVAIILPASTASTDVVLAARYLDGGGDPNAVDEQAWDESVKSLAHYPEIVHWMNENLEWTEEMGSAYLDQPENVMAAIQRARARAMANGTLVTTSEQQVVVEGGYIRIIPAQPDVIYVPRYDPEIIFVEQPPDFYPGPLITWGPAFGVGFWLFWDCDWGHRTIWCDSRPRERWNGHHDWRQREFVTVNQTVTVNNGWHQWRPPPGRQSRQRFNFNEPQRAVRQPSPARGAPRFDRDQVRLPGPAGSRPRQAEPARARPPEHREQPSRAAPRRPEPEPAHSQNAPASQHRDQPASGARPPQQRPQPWQAPPPQSQRSGDDQGQRRDRADRHDAPAPASPPTMRRDAPQADAPAPTIRRAEPSRPAQPHVAPPTQRAASPPPPAPRAEHHDSNSSNKPSNDQSHRDQR